MKTKLFLAVLTLNLTLFCENSSGNLYINPTEPLIKKSNVSSQIREFIEKKLNLKLEDNEILADISVCNCTCHDFNNTACPAFPKYLPLSLFIEQHNNGAFKLNADGSLKFKQENEIINLNVQEKRSLTKATLCLKHLKDQFDNSKLQDVLQRMYQAFKKQNSTYAELFEKQKNQRMLAAKLSSINSVYRK